MRARYTMIYTTAEGRKIVLFNLSESTVDNIKAIQETIGTKDFHKICQPDMYSQLEMDVKKKEYQ